MKRFLLATAAVALLAMPTLASAGQVIYDPADDNGRFVSLPTNSNPANAAAAAADVARYQMAAGQISGSGAVLGTHGGALAPQVINFYDPADDSGRFVSTLVIANPANAAAAAADAAPYAHQYPNMY